MGSSVSTLVRAQAEVLHARAASITIIANAEAAAVFTRSQSEAAALAERTSSEVAALAARTSSEMAALAARTSSEAAALGVRSRGETAAMKFKRLRGSVAGACMAAGGILLALDYYLHEDRDYMAGCVLRKLRSSVASSQDDLAEHLPLSQDPLAAGTLPTILLGPTGSGKTTLLRRLQQQCASAGLPAAYIGLKLQAPPRTAAAGPAEADGALLLEDLAGQLFASVGYPVRRAWIIHLLQRCLLAGGVRTQATAPEVRDRMVQALNALFSAAELIRKERIGEGVSSHDAAPVLLFDEVHDLVKDERLAAAGGRHVFDSLVKNMVIFNVDRPHVRCVMASSCAGLIKAVMETGFFGNRWSYYVLADPLPATVTALQAQGYSAAEALAMVALCGTRMGLLRQPLTLGAHALSASSFLSAMRSTGCAQIEQMLVPLAAQPSAAAALLRVLARVAECDAGTLPEEARPTIMDLPSAALRQPYQTLLFQDLRCRLHFQSQLIASMWAARTPPSPPPPGL